ncbi:MAG: pseudouridine synthase [Bacteroides sp. SM23_62_1]|nr:MAG: pseudouridine synthase [Bacteroides sp. SM23_62_1]
MPVLEKGTDFLKGSVILIDKPLGWSSFDLVNKTRILLQKRFRYKKLKVGHAGTLDPLATGLMIICTGNATKDITKYINLEKEYLATACLGKTTPSYDLETEINHTHPTEHITREKILKILPQFTGKIKQIPPVFSAKKMKGKRAYDLARKGENIELKPNVVYIREIELVEYNRPILVLRIRCGKGTYIRALARDIGESLDSGAHLVALKRTAIGDFKISDAFTLKNFEEKIKFL